MINSNIGYTTGTQQSFQFSTRSPIRQGRCAIGGKTGKTASYLDFAAAAAAHCHVRDLIWVKWNNMETRSEGLISLCSEGHFLMILFRRTCVSTWIFQYMEKIKSLFVVRSIHIFRNSHAKSVDMLKSTWWNRLPMDSQKLSIDSLIDSKNLSTGSQKPSTDSQELPSASKHLHKWDDIFFFWRSILIFNFTRYQITNSSY